ncbi:MAG: HAD family hydrolase [Lacunisphaera sp.]|nr:HAD family hydrolase [Lacunisphaera sp.]
MQTPSYRHIIWDWNGTLIDDLDYCIGIMNGILQRRGLPELDRARYHAVFDFPVRDYYARLGFDMAKDSFETLSVEFIGAYDAHRLECPLQPDTLRTLAAVQAAGLTQSILSAYRHETLLDVVGHFGLLPHFIHLAGLDNIYAHSKAELGRVQLAKLALPPREILLVGDTVHDLDVARELGVDCVLVAAGHHPADKLRRHHDRVLNSLAELPPLPGLSLRV